MIPTRQVDQPGMTISCSIHSTACDAVYVPNAVPFDWPRMTDAVSDECTPKEDCDRESAPAMSIDDTSTAFTNEPFGYGSPGDLEKSTKSPDNGSPTNGQDCAALVPDEVVTVEMQQDPVGMYLFLLLRCITQANCHISSCFQRWERTESKKGFSISP